MASAFSFSTFCRARSILSVRLASFVACRARTSSSCSSRHSLTRWAIRARNSPSVSPGAETASTAAARQAVSFDVRPRWLLSEAARLV